jgi:hypothetical protein
VIAVVEPDAQNLVRASEWGSESAATDGFHVSRRDTIRDDLGKRRELSRRKERLIEVVNDVGQVDKLVVANEHTRNLSTYGTQSNQLHVFLFSFSYRSV